MFLLKRTAASSTHWLSFWSGMWAGSTLRQSHACVQCQAMPGQLTVCGMLVWDIKIQRDSSTDLFMIQLLDDGIWATSGIFMKTRQKRFSKDWHQRSWGNRAWVQEWKSSGTDKSDLGKNNCSFYMQISCLPYSWHDFSLPSPDNPSVFSESTIVPGRVTFSFPFPRLSSDTFWSGTGYGVDFSLYNVP